MLTPAIGAEVNTVSRVAVPSRAMWSCVAGVIASVSVFVVSQVWAIASVFNSTIETGPNELWLYVLVIAASCVSWIVIITDRRKYVFRPALLSLSTLAMVCTAVGYVLGITTLPIGGVGDTLLILLAGVLWLTVMIVSLVGNRFRPES